MAGLLDSNNNGSSGFDTTNLVPVLSMLAAVGNAPGIAPQPASRLPLARPNPVNILGNSAAGLANGLAAQQQLRALQNQNAIGSMNVAGFRALQNSLGGAPQQSASGAAFTANAPTGDASNPSSSQGFLSRLLFGSNTPSTGAAPAGGGLLSPSTSAASTVAAPTAAPSPGGGLLAPSSGAASAAPSASASSSQSAAPLIDLSSLYRRAQVLSTFPAGQPLAQQYLSLIEKGLPEGAQIMSDGSIQARPGYNKFVTDKAMGEKGFVPQSNGTYAPVTGGPADLNYIGNAEAAREWGGYAPKLALEVNKPYALRGPGSSLIMNGRVIAQNPYAVDAIDTAGHTYRTFVNPPVVTAGGGGPVPAGPSGTSGTSVGGPQLSRENAQNIDVFMRRQGFGGGAAPTAPAPANPNAPNITYGANGMPVVQTGLSPLEHSSAESRGKELENFSAQIDKDAELAQQNNFLLDNMRRESQTWNMGKFADVKNDALAYYQGFANTFGIDTTGVDKRIGDFQAFQKASVELVRQAVRQTSARAAYQEFQIIAGALPNAEMSRGAFGQIADQMQGLNDYRIAMQRAAQAWRSSHNGTLDGFQSAWNQSITPTAFMVHRMSGQDFTGLAANLQKTAEGRAELAKLQTQIQTAQRLGLFDEAQ